MAGTSTRRFDGEVIVPGLTIVLLAAGVRESLLSTSVMETFTSLQGGRSSAKKWVCAEQICSRVRRRTEARAGITSRHTRSGGEDDGDSRQK